MGTSRGNPEAPPTEYTMQAEIEPAGDLPSNFGDSGYDESLTLPESISSSMFAYDKEHGRTYHASHAIGHKYAFPTTKGNRNDWTYNIMATVCQSQTDCFSHLFQVPKLS